MITLSSTVLHRVRHYSWLYPTSVILFGASCLAQENVLPDKNVTPLEWPAKPSASRPNLAFIGDPSVGAPQDDSFHMVEEEDEFPGQVVYSLTTSPRSIVFRSLGRTRRLGPTESHAVWYSASWKDEVFAPGWYPGSQDIYFRVGDPNVPGYGVTTYRWDFDTKKILRTGLGPMQLRAINWAPSGNRAAYLESSRDEQGDLQSQLNMMDATVGSYAVPLTTSDLRVAWLKDTLVFCALPAVTETAPPAKKPNPVNRKGPSPTSPKQEPARGISRTPVVPAPSRPCLYTLNLNLVPGRRPELNSKLLVKDAVNPSVSPNGRWLMYTGWLTIDAEGKTVTTGAKGGQEKYGLCLLQIATGKRYWLRPNEYDFVWWLPDSRDVIVADGKRFYMLGLNQLMAEGKFPNLVPKNIKPFGELPTVQSILLEPKGFSRSQKYFFFKSSQTTDVSLQFFHRSLQALDLANGKVKTVFEWTKDLSDLEDFDWLDESLPPVRSEKEKREEEEEEKREEEENSR